MPRGGITLMVTFRAGYNYSDSAEAVVNNLDAAINKIDFESKDTIDITEVLDLCRTSRHPAIAWSVDFVEPRPEMAKITELISSLDASIYTTSDSIILKENIKADIYQLSAFQNIRAHIRAEKGEISEAIKIYEQFTDKHLEELDLSRRSNLLFSISIAYLCTRQFKKSFHYYNELWYEIKYADPSARFQSGGIDSWILLNCVYWFFIKHVDDFRHFISSDLKLYNKDIWNHKKISFLNILHDDNSWVASLVGIGFYNEAARLMPSLPTYTSPKPYIPRNERYFHSGSKSIVSTEYDGWQKVYAEKWNHQLSYLDAGAGEYEHDLCEGFKYSFFHFLNDNGTSA